MKEFKCSIKSTTETRNPANLARQKLNERKESAKKQKEKNFGKELEKSELAESWREALYSIRQIIQTLSRLRPLKL